MQQSAVVHPYREYMIREVATNKAGLNFSQQRKAQSPRSKRSQSSKVLAGLANGYYGTFAEDAG
jgi:hypothetical protein